MGKAMTNKFKVYAQTRATRQLAGDVTDAMKYNDPARKQWDEITRLLEEVEIKLENMELSDGEGK
jgi:hypothetical protein